MRREHVKEWPYALDRVPNAIRATMADLTLIRLSCHIVRYVGIWPRAANWTVCTFHDVQNKNCCHAKCYVSRNENVEQWPYDQKLTLASVVQNQCRVPWQPHYMSCSYTWLYSYVEARKRRSLTICPRNSVWVHHQSKVLAWWLK